MTRPASEAFVLSLRRRPAIVWLRAVRARGSCFMETMVALTIVGVAIVALVEFMGGSTRAHGTVQQVLQASDYAGAALEYASNQPFTDLVAMEISPKRCSPPINGQGVSYGSEPARTWTQVIQARSVQENSIKTTATAGSSKAMRVTVIIEHNGTTVHSESRLFMGDL